MDMLYRRYANPMELISLYINRGRFGEFVSEFLKSEYKRLKTEAEQDDNWKLWVMYVHSVSDLPFNEWKTAMLGGSGKDSGDYNLTDEDVNQILNDTFNT